MQEKVYVKINFNDPEEFESFYEAGLFLGNLHQVFEKNLNDAVILKNYKDGLIEVITPLDSMSILVYRTNDFLDFNFNENDYKEFIQGLKDGFYY
jgi:hypothetical protein